MEFFSSSMRFRVAAGGVWKREIAASKSFQAIPFVAPSGAQAVSCPRLTGAKSRGKQETRATPGTHLEPVLTHLFMW